MSTLDHLRRAILERPFQDEPRLIYADALSETGRPEDWDDAEMIRAQVRNLSVGGYSYTLNEGLQVFDCGGLIFEVKGNLDSILTGLWLWQVHPIANVVVTDKVPIHYPRLTEYVWWYKRTHGIIYPQAALPDRVWYRLNPDNFKCSSSYERSYRTEPLAMLDLSRAIVAEGRHLAGLPPLVWRQS